MKNTLIKNTRENTLSKNTRDNILSKNIWENWRKGGKRGPRPRSEFLQGSSTQGTQGREKVARRQARKIFLGVQERGGRPGGSVEKSNKNKNKNKTVDIAPRPKKKIV